jgi:hypothetical protein
MAFFTFQASPPGHVVFFVLVKSYSSFICLNAIAYYAMHFLLSFTVIAFALPVLVNITICGITTVAPSDISSFNTSS